ncbi:hypothetical protein [Rhizobium sp. Root1220]|uniref:hypothetical protein n=1 Tax=Rhizobium sp. Root1220 TaxID=1736432 RepID=UPI0006F5AEA0|nr:hypothetical protein [Rhizobium sp. Root1220]KQV68311.1 hypothetical protein ASC90_11880 [Rhizobium sp. Root1220]
MGRVHRLGTNRIDAIALAQRSALAMFSIAATVLPILNINFMGASDDVVLRDIYLLGAAAYLLPMAYLSGLATVFLGGMRSHRRFIDLAGLIIASVAVCRTAYVLVSTRMPQTAIASQVPSNLDQSTTVSLCFGVISILLLVVGGCWQLRKSWRG